MKTMKHITHTIALLGLLLALSVPAQAVISPFVRAGFDFSKLNGIQGLSSDATWKDKLSGWDVGYFGEGGITFFGSHTIAAEIGYMKAKASLGTGTAGVESREQVPLLLNYRNSFNAGPVSLFLGVSAGMMSDKASWRQDISGAAESWDKFSSGNWVGLYGATGGLGFKFSKHWAFDFGVRVLAVNAKVFSDKLPDAETSYKIGKNEWLLRPNVRFALSASW